MSKTKRRSSNSIHKNLFEARYVSNDNRKYKHASCLNRISKAEGLDCFVGIRKIMSYFYELKFHITYNDTFLPISQDSKFNTFVRTTKVIICLFSTLYNILAF